MPPARGSQPRHSIFQPSDDATVSPFLVPSNFFAVVSLRQAAEMVEQIQKDAELARACRSLADEVEGALRQHAVVSHPQAGRVYAFVSERNPYYCLGTAAKGLGGPQVGLDMIWPLGVIMDSPARRSGRSRNA